MQLMKKHKLSTISCEDFNGKKIAWVYFRINLRDLSLHVNYL